MTSIGGENRHFDCRYGNVVAVGETWLDANTPKPSKYALALAVLYEGRCCYTFGWQYLASSRFLGRLGLKVVVVKKKIKLNRRYLFTKEFTAPVPPVGALFPPAHLHSTASVQNIVVISCFYMVTRT